MRDVHVLTPEEALQLFGRRCAEAGISPLEALALYRDEGICGFDSIALSNVLSAIWLAELA